MPERVQIGDAELWLGRCEDVLPQFEYIPAIVIDPPYGLGEANGKARGKLGVTRYYDSASWDDRPLDAGLIDFMRGISDHQIIFGGNFYELPPTSCWLVWDKENGATDFADCELAWTNLPNAVRRLRYQWSGCMRKERDEPRVHPTQKPVGVMVWAIGHLPPHADPICDPTMGSGTTGVACTRLGKRFIGIEQDAKHFATAVKRIEDAQRQGRLFDQHPPAPVQQQLAMERA